MLLQNIFAFSLPDSWTHFSHFWKRRVAARNDVSNLCKQVVLSCCHVWWVVHMTKQFSTTKDTTSLQVAFAWFDDVLSSRKYVCVVCWISGRFLRRCRVQFGKVRLVTCAITSFIRFKMHKADNTMLMQESQTNSFFPKPFVLVMVFVIWPVSTCALFCMRISW